MNFVAAKIEHIGYHPRLGANQTIPIRLVIRSGYTDFVNDGNFNAPNEEVIVKEVVLKPRLRYQDWYWNATTQEFQMTPVG